MVAEDESASGYRRELLYRVIAGCLGGITVSIMSSLGSLAYPEVFMNLSPPYILGLALRTVVFGLLGAMWVFQAPRGVPQTVAFQLGMIPYIFIGLAFTNTSPAKMVFPPERSSLYERPPAALTVYNETVSAARVWSIQASRDSTPTSANPAMNPGSGLIAGLTGVPPSYAPGTGIGFWIIFGVVSLFTLLSGIANVYLVVANATSANAISLVDNFNTTWKLGFGAIIGLIGGKTF